MLFLSALFLFGCIPIISKKLCINCKYYIHGVNKIGDNRLEIGKCKLFPIIESLDNKFQKNNYFYCSTAREDKNMCGEDGLYYKGYNKMDPLFLLCKQIRDEQERIENKLKNEKDDITRIQNKMKDKDI